MFLRAKRRPIPGLYVPIEKHYWGYVSGIFGSWIHCTLCKVAFKNEIGFDIVTDRVISFPSEEDKQRKRVRYYDSPKQQTLCKECACQLVQTAYDRVKREQLPGDICNGFDPHLLTIKPEEMDWAIDFIHSVDTPPKMNLRLESERGAIAVETSVADNSEIS